MRVLLQKVNHAKVTIAGEVVGSIQKGYTLLVGIAPDDTEANLDYLVRKIVNVRIFEDEEGKMNLALKDVDGEILSISQFTLYADTKKGNRPGFSNAAGPELAEPLYQQFNDKLRAAGVHVETGHFGAEMQVELENDGPTTIWYEK
ncbi:D-tyrosyl-tRNA(Tyr) deacylase [Paucilactobacillus oligofermentans DSM 15707 = LMG 22743]|uniref:D-aminoacyl-tRNA deacylase n=1 Tax=Paucilactobacillus oligofermentans DSM 15707 = LMG 22743 TaxID=1423778 RepID=A0A0R1RCF8_9LACO|nr:D-aminoacyl-tRNA deacylase [Paucilactobacillus oligofermentans]KRL54784.1 D-tyrosyl-tRNA(Tyr) deacylase [Paucilactobacillus oligofermentans DSM 15707 = LMG 22743]CUS26301.1 D-tyrosyl-tRNA(Tyr) deacylase [Paucilactobacillus oligofermentans DSM 15707 = LMG 22743]